MLDREVDGGLDGIAAVSHLMMRFETRLQAVENGHRLAQGRLADVDFLETPRQGAVFFEYPAVFLEGGRTDAAQFTVLQHRLDQVGGIHGAAGGGTGTDDGMDFIDEQDGIRLFFQLGQHRFQALFEVAAVFCARHQRTEIQSPDHGRAQHLRHTAFHDAPGQAFGERGFTHARITDIQRIVLASATQDLDGALDFLLAADQRVDLAFDGELVEVDREFGQCIALGFLGGLRSAAVFGRLFGRLSVARHAMRQVIHHIQPGDVLLLHQVDGVRIFFTEYGHQHIGAGHFLLARRLDMVNRTLEHALETERRLGIAVIVFGKNGDVVVDGLAQAAGELVDLGAAGAQHPERRSVFKQRQQEMVDRHEFMA